MLKSIISKSSTPTHLKTTLLEVVNMARKAGEEEWAKGEHIPPNLVEALHKKVRADLCIVIDTFNLKFSKLQTSQKELLNSAEVINKKTENLQNTTKELETKAGKVDNTMVKIASLAMSYKDVLLKTPPNTNRAGADPKVLSDLNRRAKQILICYSSAEDNAMLNKSLLELKDKANRIIVGY